MNATYRPSGETLGIMPVAVPVIAVRVPVAARRTSGAVADESSSTTSVVPSGSQDGALMFVPRDTGVPPLAGTTYTDGAPPVECVNAIVLPSGDQAGSTSSPVSDVSWRGVPVPSAGRTQMSS